jgi:hypothetical protein
VKLPKLDYVSGYQCLTGTGKRLVKSSSSADYYTVHISTDERTPHTCICPHFTFRGLELHFETCRHIDKALEDVCGWNSVIHGGQVVDCPCGGGPYEPDAPCSSCHGKGIVCPRCGGPLESVMVGV